MKLETPDHVENRVFHEKEIPPGAICRKHWKGDSDEWTTTDWFIVLTPPKMRDGVGEFVEICWLEGDKKWNHDKYFLGDIGVHPPHRAVCEKHDIQIPERYVTTSRLGRAVAGIASRITVM